MKKNRVLAFSGSNNSKSINQELVKSAAALLKQSEVKIICLQDYPAPIFSMDIEIEQGLPKSILDLKQLFLEYDAFLISLPEHNGMVTAIFKNTLDWLSRIEMSVFSGKPVCLLSASVGEGGGAYSREYVSKLMHYWSGRVISEFSIGEFDNKWDWDLHRARDKETQSVLEETIRIFEKEINK